MSDIIRMSKRDIPSVEMDSLPGSYEDFVRPRIYQPMLRDLLMAPGYDDQKFDPLPNAAANPERGVLPPAEDEWDYDKMMPDRIALRTI